MADEAVLAREFDLAINTGSDAVPTWTDITGIQGITPSQTAQRTDDTDFDTDGWEAHTVVMRGKGLSVAVLYKEDDTTGLPSAGQQALIDLGDAVGSGSKKQFKYTLPGGGAYTFTASADIAWPGGDKVSNATMTADLTVSGAPTYAAPA